MSSKKVLIVATVPSMVGMFNMRNIEILQDIGYKVHVACNFEDTSAWPIEEVDNFIKKMKELHISYFQVDFSRSAMQLYQHIKSYRQILYLMKSNCYSFVHTHTPIASAIARLAAHRTNTKVIYTAHGFHFYNGASVKSWILYYPLEKFLSYWTDILITINHEDHHRAIKKFHAGKTVFIPGIGIDIEKISSLSVNKKEKRRELEIPEEAFIFLSVGELSKRKNHKVVIEALGKIQNPSIYYLIAGTGKSEKIYRNLIKYYKLENNIKILGYRDDIIELCKISDCFIHPSLREGLGIAPIEAMASGLPLIASNINGIKDYARDRITGICVDPHSISEMKTAIEIIARNTDENKKYINYNKEEAKKYDINIVDKIMKNIYSDLNMVCNL